MYLVVYRWRESPDTILWITESYWEHSSEMYIASNPEQVENFCTKYTIYWSNPDINDKSINEHYRIFGLYTGEKIDLRK